MKAIRNSSFQSGCISAAVALFLGTPAFAGTPIGGLTVTLSPDESTLIASGDPRTLYVTDPATLEVKDRIWVETSVFSIDYNKDGSVLAVHDTKDEVRLYSTSDWSLMNTIKGCYSFTVSREADIFAGYYVTDAVAKIYSFSDGSEKASIQFPERTGISAMGLSADGSKLAIIFKDDDDEEEEKLGYSDIPKDLKGLDKDRFQLEHDGKTSKIGIYDTATGDVIKEFKTFYTSTSESQITFDGDSIVVLNYRNLNAFISPEGEVEMFQMPSSFNYGMGFAPDKSLVMGGGLAKASFMKVADKSFVEYSIDKLPGWPEYFQGFCASSDGTVYGATSAYRVIKVAPDGTVQEQKPVH